MKSSNKALKLRKRKGFTLIELVVVIGILAVLAVVSIRAFSGQGEGARNSQHLAYMSQIDVAATEYMSRYGTGGTDGLETFKKVDADHPIVQLGFTKAAENPWVKTAEPWKDYDYYVGVKEVERTVGGVTKTVPLVVVTLSDAAPVLKDNGTLSATLNYIQMDGTFPSIKAGAVDSVVENVVNN